MPQKPNSKGEMQEYIPAGNGDASGEYGNSKGENKHFSSFKKPKENKLEGRTFYHGSPTKNIKEFDETRAGENVSADFSGIYFTDDKDFADEFSYERLPSESMFLNKKGEKGSVYEANLDMKNPLDLNNLTDENLKDIKENYLLWYFGDTEDVYRKFKDYIDHGNPQGAKIYLDFKKIAEDGKYDGFIADLGKKERKANEYVVFKGKQAKILKEY